MPKREQLLTTLSVFDNVLEEQLKKFDASDLESPIIMTLLSNILLAKIDLLEYYEDNPIR